MRSAEGKPNIYKGKESAEEEKQKKTEPAIDETGELEKARGERVLFEEAIENSGFNESDKKRVIDAYNLMLELHADQKDDYGNPYISHLLKVAYDILNRYGVKDPDEIIGGLLHDSIEDQYKKLSGIEDERGKEVALDKIGKRYGDRVKKIVKMETNPDFEKILKKNGIDENDKERFESGKNELYKEHVRSIIKDPDVFVVKFADFMVNTSTIEKAIAERKKHFINKYGPVIKDVFLPAFREMKPDHPLYKNRGGLIKELESLWEQHFASS